MAGQADRISSGSLEWNPFMSPSKVGSATTQVFRSPEGKSMQALIAKVEDWHAEQKAEGKLPFAPGLTPPPTPMKKRPGREISRTPERISPFRALCQQVSQSQKIMIAGQQVQLSLLSGGSFMDVFTLRAPTLLFPPAPNESFVLKMFNKTIAAESESTLTGYLYSSLENYREAVSHGIPIATIYNLDTATSDRLIIQEKVPHALDIDNPLHVQQYKQFFRVSLTQDIKLDLIPSNLRVREDGRVLLIDFVEDPSDSLALFIDHALQGVCQAFMKSHGRNRPAVEAFLNDFTQDFPESFDRTIKQRVLTLLFPISQ